MTNEGVPFGADAVGVSLPPRKPFKVWSGDRRLRKAIVVSTLDEFVDLGCAKLGYSHQVYRADLRVVLECDGTEVECETYFSSLPRDSILQILLPNETWVPPSVEAIKTGAARSFRSPTADTVDTSMPSTSSLYKSTTISGDCLDSGMILDYLSDDVSNVLLLKDEQLELMSEMMHLPDSYPFEFGRKIVELCDRTLNDRRQAQEAMRAIQFIRNRVDRDELDRGAENRPSSSKKTADTGTQTAQAGTQTAQAGTQGTSGLRYETAGDADPGSATSSVKTEVLPVAIKIESSDSDDLVVVEDVNAAEVLPSESRRKRKISKRTTKADTLEKEKGKKDPSPRRRGRPRKPPKRFQ